MTTIHSRQSYAADPLLAQGVFALLESCFPGVSAVIQRAAELEARWEDASTPFVRTEDGRVVSHVGVLELPLVLGSQAVTAGGIHGVCTLAEQRGHGHFRALMEDALRHAGQRYETLVLTTLEPAIYERFGFRVVPEHRFVVPGARGKADADARELSWDDAQDVSLLHRLLATREPVSQVLGVGPERAVFLFNQCQRPVTYIDTLDVAACLTWEGTRLLVHDVVGPRLCTLRQLLAHLPQQPDEVILHYSPDRMGVAKAVEQSHRYDGTVLMARGWFPVGSAPVLLPSTARC